METRIEKDGATFRVSGNYDPQVQREIISSYIRAQLIKQLSAYGVSTVFILSGCFLIAFSPPGREQTTTVIAVALFAIAIGIGGFSYFRLKAPLVSTEVGTMGAQQSKDPTVESSVDVGRPSNHYDDRK